MSLKIVVLAKQGPDTRNVGKDAMNADGTINRAALPAIFNPEDLNALEQALRLKDTHPGSTVTILTMGPGRAAEISLLQQILQLILAHSLTVKRHLVPRNRNRQGCEIDFRCRT